MPIAMPKARKVYTWDIEQFRGIDLTNAPENVDPSRSPNAPNMIRDVPGKVRKRVGYETRKQFNGPINGRYILGNNVYIHHGHYLAWVENWTSMEHHDVYTHMGGNSDNKRSSGVQLNGKLYLFDGYRAIYCEKEDPSHPKNLDNHAYTPTIVIGRAPSGGGTSYEPFNLLNDAWTEQFIGDGTARYQLSLTDLSKTKPVKVEVLEGSPVPSWKKKTVNTHYTVDYDLGVVTFTAGNEPGVPPVAGQDNVKITAYKSREEGRAKINGCNICTLYGVNGSPDRIFVSGNPDYPNYDWYSQYNDPTFFGDLWYCVLGQDDSKVVGYSLVNEKLCTHKDRAENDRNVIVRKGTLMEEGDETTAAFPIISILQGDGAIASKSFAFLGTEPLFLTKNGICALTAQDTTGERYMQNRSYYINKVLTEEPHLSGATAFVYKDMYFLAMQDGGVYILDGLQKTYERGTPYSTYQYECYYWPDINARVMWEDEFGRLCFGTDGGAVNRFYEDSESTESYADNGLPISASWEIPDFDGKLFYENKTLRWIAVRAAPFARTSVRFQGMTYGDWADLSNQAMTLGYLSFQNLQFSTLKFGDNSTSRTLGLKFRARHIDKMRFRFSNDALKEPFAIYEVALEYREQGTGKHRR